MIKRVLKSPGFARALGGVIGFYMRVVDLTTWWTVRGREHMLPFWEQRRAVIIGVWHGRLMQMHKCWPKRHARTPGHVLISQSREGEVVAAATRHLGYGVVRGSSAKAGKAKGTLAALREMLKRLEAGETIAMTPDGPKGPRMRAGLGPAQLARLSGAPIVPIAWATRNSVTLQSWDRFQLPLPFGRGLFLWGAPILVPADADAATLEAARARLEAELIRLTAEADAWAGRPAIEPAPPPALAQAPS